MTATTTRSRVGAGQRIQYGRTARLREPRARVDRNRAHARASKGNQEIRAAFRCWLGLPSTAVPQFHEMLSQTCMPSPAHRCKQRNHGNLRKRAHEIERGPRK